MWLPRSRNPIQRGSDRQVQQVGHDGQLDYPKLLARLRWEVCRVQVEWVAPVGVVDHQGDLQEDHRGVVEMTLEMSLPGVRSLVTGTQFQQPDLKLWAHCVLRPQHAMLGVPSPECVRGYVK